MNKIAFFLPTRKGSERVKNKNTRPFAGIEGGLMENKIRQLLQTKSLDEIIISTNDEQCITIAEKYQNDNRLKIVLRPDYLCSSATNLSDLISYVPTLTDADTICWGHVTTPFAGAEQYDNAISEYQQSLSQGYDSLVGVSEFRNFLMDKQGRLVNNTTKLDWPRTQDLEVLYEINHTVFIAPRNVYVNQKNRLGKHPFPFVMDKIHSFDIDWEDDFKMAEMMYKSFAL